MSIFKNRTVIGVICILLALVICFGITPLFNQSISQRSEIVRVTKDIHAGELITKDMVATAEVGSYNLPSGLMTAKDNVVGKYARRTLPLAIIFSPPSSRTRLPPRMRISIIWMAQSRPSPSPSRASPPDSPVSSRAATSYRSSWRTTRRTAKPPSPAELQYVEIISVTASTGYDANTGEAKGDEKELPSTVTFLVLPEQAKVLAELEQVAKLHLALVYRGTTDGARQFIERRTRSFRSRTQSRRKIPLRRAKPPILPQKCRRVR